MEHIKYLSQLITEMVSDFRAKWPWESLSPSSTTA